MSYLDADVMDNFEKLSCALAKDLGDVRVARRKLAECRIDLTQAELTIKQCEQRFLRSV